jgi:hypothetical protein
MKKDLMDWKVEEFKGENILFYKGKNYVPIDAVLQLFLFLCHYFTFLYP